MAKQIVSWSEIDRYRQCPHAHDLEYLQRWVNPKQSDPLARGNAWHAVLERHYDVLQHNRAQLGPSQLRSLAIEVAGVLEAVEDVDIRELVSWMYEGYLEHYGLDPEWEVVSVENRILVPLPNMQGRPSRFVLKAKLDLVVRWKKRLWIVDHKSCKDLPGDKMLELDDQFGLYTWAMRMLGHDIFGSLHSSARTQRNKVKSQPLEERFKRIPLYRTDNELVRIANDAFMTVRDAHRKRKEGEAAERNTNTDTCRWRCSFTEACLHGRKTTDAQEIGYLESAGFVQNFTRH